jgi:hypothetical protein
MHQLIHNSRTTKYEDLLDYSKTADRCGFPLPNLHSVESLHIVPNPEIKKICRLHIERHNDYDFFNQWATTICCGMACFL